MKIVANWFRRYFSEPQIILLAMLLLILFAMFLLLLVGFSVINLYIGGVFFAIPLVTLVQATLAAWPIPPDEQGEALA